MTLGQGSPSYAVTAVGLSQGKPGADVGLSFTTSELPLLNRIFKAEGVAEAIPGSPSPSVTGPAPVS